MQRADYQLHGFPTAPRVGTPTPVLFKVNCITFLKRENCRHGEQSSGCGWGGTPAVTALCVKGTPFSPYCFLQLPVNVRSLKIKRSI